MIRCFSLPRWASIAAAALVLCSTAAGPALAGRGPRGPEGERRQPRPPAEVPLDHWSCGILDRLVSRGFVALDLTTLPVSRDAVRRALVAARRRWRNAACDAGMTPREQWAFGRLEAEFLRGEVDRPALAAKGDGAILGVGLSAGVRADYAPDSPEGAGFRDGFNPAVDVAYELWGGAPGLLGFRSDAVVVLSGQEGDRQVRLSSRARTWRGIVATVERSYVMLERPSFSVLAGRSGDAWGRSRRSGLLLSGRASTFDELSATFSVGRLSFKTIHALVEYERTGTESDLDDSERVYLAGHRAVFGFGAGSVGISEVVVYSSVLPDPVYLNPLAPYYLSQHNERSNDNVLWSLDFLARPFRGLDVYGEFLVDDLMYERTVEHPDKYGFAVGQVCYGALGRTDVEFAVEYAQVRKWTYTHSKVEHRFVHDSEPVGFELGPDSDRLLVALAFHPSLKWSLEAESSFSRRGEGRTEEPFEEGTPFEPEFPSGVVERVSRFSLRASYDDLSGLRGELGVVFSRTANEGNVSGADDDRWEIVGCIGFRI